MNPEDYYEDDELIEDIRRAWREGERGVTVGPRRLSPEARQLAAAKAEELDAKLGPPPHR